MAGISGSRRRRSATLVAAALGVALAACGSDAPATTSATGATTTRLTSSTTASTAPPRTTTTVLDGPIPIPTDPADLLPCADVDPGEPALMPSRRWPTLPTGWKVRYAYTTRPEGEAGATYGWSTLVRVGPDRRVTGLVLVNDLPVSGGAAPNATVRGQPAWVGDQTTRGGPTGATEVDWKEGDRFLVAVTRGLDRASVVPFLDALELDGGTVTTDPPGWRRIGAGRTDGVLSSTVIGITPPGADLLDTGYAPVEVQVEEHAAGTTSPDAIHLPSGLDVEHTDVWLLGSGDRPSLLVALDDRSQLLMTTTTDGAPVTASGSATGADLDRLASDLTTVAPDDGRLVGIPMGTPSSSPGRFCR